MEETVKNNIFYKPELEIDRNYHSSGSFIHTGPVTLPDEIPSSDIEDTIKRNENTIETLVTINNILDILPERLGSTIKDIVETVALKAAVDNIELKEDIEKEPDNENTDESQQTTETQLSSLNGGYVVDDDGFVWGEAEGSGLTIELTDIKANDELAREQYLKDSSLINEDYAKNMAHVIQKYLYGLSAAMAECGLDKVDYLNYDYEGQSVTGIEDNYYHLNDIIARNQTIVEETSRLFAKTHSTRNTNNIITQLDVVAQERIRYYKEEYDLEITGPLDIANRILLQKTRALYDNKYFYVKMDAYKYLDSATKVTEDILNKALDMQQAKAKLLTEGVNVFTHKKYEETQASNSLTGSTEKDSAKIRNAEGIKATSTTAGTTSNASN